VPLAAQPLAAHAVMSYSLHTSPADSTLSEKESIVRADAWLASDKAKHFGVSFLLVIFGTFVAEKGLKFDAASSTASAAGSTALIGFGKELWDDRSPHNIFSLKDLLADALGIVAALLTLHLAGLPR
jgi:uncharacterized protein YfiM (DUF2279 family)